MSSPIRTPSAENKNPNYVPYKEFNPKKPLLLGRHVKDQTVEVQTNPYEDYLKKCAFVSGSSPRE